MARSSQTQAKTGDFFSRLSDIGFQAAENYVSNIATKNRNMPAPPPAPTVQFAPVQTPTVQKASGINPTMIAIIAAGFLAVVMLMRK
jgi:hypothetical protein